jgi:hypothetical protein
MKKWITPLLALIALLSLAACHSSSEIISRGLRIVVTKIERAPNGTYEISWQVENPNVVAYVVDHSEHKVFVNDLLVGSVSRKARQGVPIQARAEGVDPLILSSPSAGDTLAQLVGKDAVPYRIDSTIWVLLAEDETSKSQLTSSGTVAITAK